MSDHISKKVSNATLQFTSKVASETTSFVWEIKDIKEIQRMKTWEAVTCQVDIHGFTWRLSLKSDDRYLYAVPTLLEPEKAVTCFTMKILVLNNANGVAYTPIQKEPCIHVCTAGSKIDQKWEVLKFGETNFDYFSNLVCNGYLKLFVEITVFYDNHGA